MRTDILERKKEILNWIKEKRPKAFMCNQLRCKPETLNGWFIKMNIVYVWSPDMQIANPQRRSAKEYIEINAVRSCILKKKLIEEGIKKAKCEECKRVTWNNSPIPTELHHKDGDRFNNELENLQILCLNCHAQTKNYRRKKSSLK